MHKKDWNSDINEGHKKTRFLGKAYFLSLKKKKKSSLVLRLPFLQAYFIFFFFVYKAFKFVIL